MYSLAVCALERRLGVSDNVRGFETFLRTLSSFLSSPPSHRPLNFLTRLSTDGCSVFVTGAFRNTKDPISCAKNFAENYEIILETNGLRQSSRKRIDNLPNLSSSSADCTDGFCERWMIDATPSSERCFSCGLSCVDDGGLRDTIIMLISSVDPPARASLTSLIHAASKSLECWSAVFTACSGLSPSHKPSDARINSSSPSANSLLQTSGSAMMQPLYPCTRPQVEKHAEKNAFALLSPPHGKAAPCVVYACRP